MKNYYYILGLSNKASPIDIHKAYRKLSLKFHPDTNNGDKFFEDRFKEIKEAYDVLRDEQTKILYDIRLREFLNIKNDSNNKTYSANTEYSNQKSTNKNPNYTTNKNNSQKNSGNEDSNHYSNQNKTSDDDYSGLTIVVITIIIFIVIAVIGSGINRRKESNNLTYTASQPKPSNTLVVDTTSATNNSLEVTYSNCKNTIVSYIDMINRREYSNLASYFSPLVEKYYGDDNLLPIDAVIKVKSSFEDEPIDSHFNVQDLSVSKNEVGYIVECSQTERVLQKSNRLPYIYYTHQWYKLDTSLKIYSVHGKILAIKPDIMRFLGYSKEKNDSDFVSQTTKSTLDTILYVANNIQDSAKMIFYRDAITSLYGKSVRVFINNNNKYNTFYDFINGLVNKSYRFVRTNDILKDNNSVLSVIYVSCE